MIDSECGCDQGRVTLVCYQLKVLTSTLLSVSQFRAGQVLGSLGRLTNLFVELGRNTIFTFRTLGTLDLKPLTSHTRTNTLIENYTQQTRVDK